MRSDNRAPTPASRKTIFSGYLIGWTALAAGSLGYLTVAAANPQLLTGLLPMAAQPEREAEVVQQDLVQQVATLKKWVHSLQHDLAAAKSTIQTQKEAGDALQRRLADAEAKLAEQSGKMASAGEAKAAQKAKPTPPRATANARSARPQKAASAARKVAARRPTTSGVKVINPSNSASAITTGSVAAPRRPPPARFGAAKVSKPAVKGPVGIVVGSGDSLDTLRLHWAALTTANGRLLTKLAPRYRISANGSGNPFTLLAGPFGTTRQAEQTCARLKARGIACQTGRYVGNAL